MAGDQSGIALPLLMRIEGCKSREKLQAIDIELIANIDPLRDFHFVFESKGFDEAFRKSCERHTVG